MKVLYSPRWTTDKAMAIATIILLGTAAALFLRMLIVAFCESLSRAMFFGL